MLLKIRLLIWSYSANQSNSLHVVRGLARNKPNNDNSYVTPSMCKSIAITSSHMKWFNQMFLPNVPTHVGHNIDITSIRHTIEHLFDKMFCHVFGGGGGGSPFLGDPVSLSWCPGALGGPAPLFWGTKGAPVLVSWGPVTMKKGPRRVPEGLGGVWGSTLGPKHISQDPFS